VPIKKKVSSRDDCELKERARWQNITCIQQLGAAIALLECQGTMAGQIAPLGFATATGPQSAL
jgi:hypothetical protein